MCIWSYRSRMDGATWERLPRAESVADDLDSGAGDGWV